MMLPGSKEMGSSDRTPVTPVPLSPQRGGTTNTGEPEGVHILIIEAIDRTWLQIKAGSLPADDITLYPQETYVRKSTDPFELVIGNAGGVTITFDGTNMGSPGERGQVVRLVLPEGTQAEAAR